ncbi:hypothetical protein [Morganella morganii]|nr:hypothetical protein [Morganella morganii]
MNEYEPIFRDTCEFYLKSLHSVSANYLAENKSDEEIKILTDNYINKYIELSLDQEEFDNYYSDVNIHNVIGLNNKLSLDLSIMSYIRATQFYAKNDFNNASMHINEALFQIGLLHGYYLQALYEERSSEHMSKAASETEKAKNSRRIKKEILDYLSENARKYPWTSIDDCIPELISMLTEKAKNTREFTINPDTIRANIKKWARSSSKSESDREFQEQLAELFYPA